MSQSKLLYMKKQLFFMPVAKQLSDNPISFWQAATML